MCRAHVNRLADARAVLWKGLDVAAKAAGAGGGGGGSMNETFKHVSVFIVFLSCAIYLDKLRAYVERFFNFDFGDTALLLCNSTAVVILFHVLYHYFGRWPEKVAYILAGVMVALTLILMNFDVLHLK